MPAYNCTDCNDTGEYFETVGWTVGKTSHVCGCSTGQALREKWRADDDAERARFKDDREFVDDMMSVPHPDACRGAYEWMCCNNVVSVPGSYCEKCEKERFQ